MIKKLFLVLVLCTLWIILLWNYSLIKNEYKEKWLFFTIEAVQLFSTNKKDLTQNIIDYTQISQIVIDNNIHSIFLEKNKEIIIDSKININKDQEILIWNFMIKHWIEWILNQNFNPSIFTEWIFFLKWSIKYQRNKIKWYLYYNWDYPKINKNNYNSQKMYEYDNNWIIIK